MYSTYGNTVVFSLFFSSCLHSLNEVTVFLPHPPLELPSTAESSECLQMRRLKSWLRSLRSIWGGGWNGGTTVPCRTPLRYLIPCSYKFWPVYVVVLHSSKHLTISNSTSRSFSRGCWSSASFLSLNFKQSMKTGHTFFIHQYNRLMLLFYFSFSSLTSKSSASCLSWLSSIRERQEEI